MTDGGPEWLPELILFSDYGGEWDAYLAALYEVFLNDFVNHPPVGFDGKRVGLKRHPMLEGKEATFWHFISEGATEEQRIPDLRRCERIRWPRAMMDAIDSGNVCAWKGSRGAEDRYLVSLPDFSYVLVLADRGTYVLPWTAFCVEHQHRQIKLRREYESSRKGWCRP